MRKDRRAKKRWTGCWVGTWELGFRQRFVVLCWTWILHFYFRSAWKGSTLLQPTTLSFFHHLSISTPPRYRNNCNQIVLGPPTAAFYWNNWLVLLIIVGLHFSFNVSNGWNTKDMTLEKKLNKIKKGRKMGFYYIYKKRAYPRCNFSRVCLAKLHSTLFEVFKNCKWVLRLTN